MGMGHAEEGGEDGRVASGARQTVLFCTVLYCT